MGSFGGTGTGEGVTERNALGRHVESVRIEPITHPEQEAVGGRDMRDFGFELAEPFAFCTVHV